MIYKLYDNLPEQQFDNMVLKNTGLPEHLARARKQNQKNKIQFIALQVMPSTLKTDYGYGQDARTNGGSASRNSY